MRTELLGITVVTVLLIARLVAPIAVALLVGTLIQRRLSSGAR
jgi:hypothetical protein